MASGVEPLELRKEKIQAKREEKLEKARARQEAAAEQEQIGQPAITSKAQRVARNYEDMARWDERKNQKLMQRQHQRYQEKLQECTFQPHICNSSRKIAEGRLRREGNIFHEEGGAYLRLHDDAHRRQEERATASYAELEAGQRATASTPRRRAGEHNVSTVSSKASASKGGTTPTRAAAKTSSGRANGAAVRGPAPANGGQPLSFEAFMKSLPNAGQRSAWSSPAEALLPDGEYSLFDPSVAPEPSSARSPRDIRGRSPREGLPFERLAREGGGVRRVPSTSGMPAAMISDTEDELLLAEGPRHFVPTPSVQPSPTLTARSQSPLSRYIVSDGLEEALPQWASLHANSGSAANSARSTPRQVVRPAPPSAWPLGGSPTSVSGMSSASGGGKRTASRNELMYTNAFDDVFRIGYGGALPGTLV